MYTRFIMRSIVLYFLKCTLIYYGICCTVLFFHIFRENVLNWVLGLFLFIYPGVYIFSKNYFLPPSPLLKFVFFSQKWSRKWEWFYEKLNEFLGKKYQKVWKKLHFVVQFFILAPPPSPNHQNHSEKYMYTPAITANISEINKIIFFARKFHFRVAGFKFVVKKLYCTHLLLSITLGEYFCQSHFLTFIDISTNLWNTRHINKPLE